MVGLLALDDPREQNEVRRMIQRHFDYTGSVRGHSILESWDESLASFVRVLPHEYARVMETSEAETTREELRAHG